MKKKIAFISAYNTSFVRRDIEILNEQYQVEHLNFSGIKKGIIPLIKQFFQISASLRRCDLAFVWFADLRAFLTGFICKILCKEMLVVVGGYELANHPEISYGAMINDFSRWRVKKILEWAAKVLVVDESLKEEAIANIGAKPEKITVLPTGYDPELFKPSGEKKEEVLLVASAVVEQTLFVKGIYNYLEVARHMPDFKFNLVGISGEALRLLNIKKPENLTLTGFLKHSDLIKEMQKAKVYCQLSLREGLPNALCEAMLCNCIPVGTNVNGIPKAIGETGYLVEHGNIQQTINAIKKAMNLNLSDKPRNRIINLFPINMRKTKLNEIINQI